MTPYETGTVLDGRFVVERVIGSGAMGIVVAAQHIGLRERVALKFLKPELLGTPELVARFEREARAAAKIRSEHVARVTDVARLPTGEPYMVMEYLQGQDLRAYVRERGRLPLTEAADYVLQVSEALAEAHALGIVHRDLKPENLFLTHRPDGSPCVKILDFGISKFAGVEASNGLAGTVAGGLLGSPLYMSPEQLASSRDVDARTDVWAMGVILFELLSGEPPFTGEGLPQLCVAIMNTEPAPLRKACPDLPDRVEKICLACLEKDRTKRLSSVAELAQGLADFASDHSRISASRALRIAGSAAGISVKPAPVSSTAAPDPANTHLSFVPSASRGASAGSSRRAVTIATLTLGLIAVGLVAVGVGRRRANDAGLLPMSASSSTVLAAPGATPPDPDLQAPARAPSVAPGSAQVDAPKPVPSAPVVTLAERTPAPQRRTSTPTGRNTTARATASPRSTLPSAAATPPVPPKPPDKPTAEDALGGRL